MFIFTVLPALIASDDDLNEEVSYRISLAQHWILWLAYQVKLIIIAVLSSKFEDSQLSFFLMGNFDLWNKDFYLNQE